MQAQSIKIYLLVSNTGQIPGLPKNPRLIKDEKYLKLIQSLKDDPEMLELRELIVFPFEGKYVVIAGNMRLKAMSELKYTDAPCKVLDAGTPVEKLKAYTIKDNIGYGDHAWDELQADWDVEQLEDWGLDIPAQFKVEPEAEEDEYEMPDTIETDIVLGDLFEIGQHRLLCGSSTEADAVAKLMNGKEPYLMVTDPPYGVNYDPMWRNVVEGKGFNSKIRSTGKVMNDDNADWTEAWALSPAKVAYVWHADKFSPVVAKSLTDCDFVLRSMVIWAKPSLTFGRGDYHYQHEPCWYAVKKGFKGNWAGDRKQTTLWQMAGTNPAGRSQNKNDEATGHGTQKPIEAMARPIGNHDGDVHDPFLGSGSTMVAAHQLNRKCYGMELDPKYCQVIIDRMRKLDPSLTIKKNGEPYEAKQEA